MLTLRIMSRLVLSLIFLATAVYARHEQYEGHQLFRIRGPQKEIAALDGSLDFLKLTARPDLASILPKLEAVVRLSPEEKQQWLMYFEQKEITYTNMADNLAEILRKEEAQIEASRRAARRSGRKITYDTYYRHEEINDHLDSLAAQYPDRVTVINAGLSYEGRQIKYVRISTSRFEAVQKPVIIIDAAVHAREWVTPPVALYIIDQLVVNLADNTLTENIDWIIIPVVNPDGYNYSFDEDRLWRKTRSKSHTNSEVCPGVDGNRNYDHSWNTSDATSSPCSLSYRGPSPFSEPEIRVVRNLIMQHLDRVAMYISVHSYGNYFLYAWGNNGTIPSNGLILNVAGVRMAEAIDKLSLDKAKRYVVGNAALVLGFSTGTSRDWTKFVGVPLTYTLELPGYEYDFIVPPQYIEQIVKETWAGIAEGAHFVLSRLE